MTKFIFFTLDSPTNTSKAPKQFSKHGSSKPYSRPFSTSATKTVRKVKMLEIDEVRELAKGMVLCFKRMRKIQFIAFGYLMKMHV